MEDSKIPLNKWILAFHLMCASKKSMSAHQLHRMLGLTYKTTWFLCHRIREAMGETVDHKETGGLGGAGKIVEVDETYVGGKAKNQVKRETHQRKPSCLWLNATAELHHSMCQTSLLKTCVR